ncbi:MAG TPA: dihydrofolate reductase family protein [Longimicrobium sp.]|nr:dihydrofolate reductase family protein [Longimicrobium sp.]
MSRRDRVPGRRGRDAAGMRSSRLHPQPGGDGDATDRGVQPGVGGRVLRGGGRRAGLGGAGGGARPGGRGEPAIEALKHQPGKDIMLFGSGSIASALTAHGLIDEYQFIVNPLLLGSGQPLIHGVPASLKLELVEASAFPSGNVRLRYTRLG